MAGEEMTAALVLSTAGSSNSATVVDLSGQGLQKLNPTLPCSCETRTLILDKNQIIKLEHLEKCKNLTQLSVANNRLVRMMGVAKLVHLRVLNLPHNSIGYVEGLKDLVHLEWLNLAGNNLKIIDQINSCASLQHLDLSDNNISQIGDLSKLLSLKTLLLHGNNITSLRAASACLPQNLAILSLAENEIRDLNEVSFLAGLSELEQLSIMNNPCVMATPSIPGFDYRPYIVSWCLNLKVLDGYVVSQKESLKAEWLYSQGKGRSYRPGQHIPLVQYLASVCPLTSAQGLQTEEDAKLEKILSKQRLHQRQLMHQIFNENNFSSTPNKRSYSFTVQQNPNRVLQRSNDTEPVIKVDNWLSTSGSEDCSLSSRNISSNLSQSGTSHYNNLYLEDVQTDEDKLNCSLLSSESTFMPVGPGLSPVFPSVEMRVPGMSNSLDANETLMEFNNEKSVKVSKIIQEKLAEYEVEKDDTCCTQSVMSEKLQQCVKNYQTPSDAVTENMQPPSHNSSHNYTVDNKMMFHKDKDIERLNCMNKAATKLQSCWRGFYSRKHNSKIKEVRYEIRLSRMQEHIVFLREEVTRLKKEKDEERMQRLLQEEAMRYLWDQVRSLQEWQNTANVLIGDISNAAICTSSKPLSESPVCSSEAQDEMSSSNSANIDIKITPDIPDSGFHSINVGQSSQHEFSSSEKNSTEGSASSEQTMETIRHLHNRSPDCPVEHEISAEEHNGSSKGNSSSEQDSSLLQQYLDKVEQLEQAEDNVSPNDVTEESRPDASNSSVSSDVFTGSLCNIICKDDKQEMQVHDALIQSCQ